MSTRSFKKFLQKSLELDDLAPAAISRGDHIKSSPNDRKEKKLKSQKNFKHRSDDVSIALKKPDNGEILQSQVESLLLFDEAFSRTSGNTKISLKRKTQDEREQKKMQKRIKSMKGTFSNSRSSSSIISSQKPEPTYNKKKAESEKELKSLEDLARKLMKHKKKRL